MNKYVGNEVGTRISGGKSEGSPGDPDIYSRKNENVETRAKSKRRKLAKASFRHVRKLTKF